MITEKIYLKPKTITEATQMASKHENDFRFLAGGTDVIVNKFQGNESSSCLIDITAIEEMKSVKVIGNNLCIGALITLDQLNSFSEIKKEFPVLLEAAKAVGSPMIRKTATIGGNILCENRCMFYNQSEWWREAVGYCLKCEGDVCIATGGAKNCFSKFVSDTAIALISLNACIEISENGKVIVLPIEDIFTGDGVAPRKLQKTALIQSVQIPLHKGCRSAFKKLRHRETMEFSSLTTCVTVNSAGEIKIVLGGVDPKPVVVAGMISDDKNELIKQAAKKARIIDNDAYTRLFRKEMITVYLNRSFEELSIK